MPDESIAMENSKSVASFVIGYFNNNRPQH